MTRAALKQTLIVMGHYNTIFRVDKATFVTAICFVILGVGHIVPSQQQLTENHQILVLCKNQSPSTFLEKGTGWGLFSQIWILLAFSSPPLLGWLEAFHAPFFLFFMQPPVQGITSVTRTVNILLSVSGEESWGECKHEQF